MTYLSRMSQITPQQATQQRAKFLKCTRLILEIVPSTYFFSFDTHLSVHRCRCPRSRTSPHPAAVVRVGPLASGMTGPPASLLPTQGAYEMGFLIWLKDGAVDPKRAPFPQAHFTSLILLEVGVQPNPTSERDTRHWGTSHPGCEWTDADSGRRVR